MHCNEVNDRNKIAQIVCLFKKHTPLPICVQATLFGSLSLVDNAVAEKALNVEGLLNARNGVRVGPNTGTCDKSRGGLIRYNEEKDTLEFCSGTTDAWVQFAQKKPTADGKGPLTAGNSCRSIKAEYKSSSDGQYWVKPDRYSGQPFKVYCDMTSSPGGWTLVSQGFGGPMPTQNWRSNNPYNEKSCENKQGYTTKDGVICKLAASKINALVSNDKTGRYKAFVPYPRSGGARTSYSPGTCVYDYNKPLQAGGNMNTNPCNWNSKNFDLSNPQTQPHVKTHGVMHYKYNGAPGVGFVWHYGDDNVRWWMVDNRHHGDIRTKTLNFIMWVY